MTYVPPTISGYNGTFAPDDGSQVAGNQITLAGVVNNLTDPLRTYASAISTAISNAFSQLLLGNTSTKTTGFTVSASNDPGKLFNCTNALTVTLPAASSAGNGFAFAVYNNSAGQIVIDGNASETINGALTITLDKQFSACFLICNGSAWYALVVNQFQTTQSTLASGSTTSLGTALSNNVNITGTTTITAFGSAASTGNPFYFLTFAGILTLTHNASSLILPGAANIVTAAGDTALAEYLGSGNWRVREYNPASGKQVAPVILNNYIAGCVLSNDGVTPNTKVDIAAGVAMDSTNAAMITSAGYTVDFTTTGANALDTGAIGATTWYHIYLIAKTDGTTAGLASTSATAPTMPSGYTLKRRIGSVKTDGSSHILAFVQQGDEFLWAASILEFDTTNPGTSAVTVTLKGAPTGVKCWALINAGLYNGTNSQRNSYWSSLDQNDEVPATQTTVALAVPGGTFLSSDTGSAWHFMPLKLRTNTSAQIRYRLLVSGAADHAGAVSMGWVDQRGKDN